MTNLSVALWDVAQGTLMLQPVFAKGLMSSHTGLTANKAGTTALSASEEPSAINHRCIARRATLHTTSDCHTQPFGVPSEQGQHHD